MLLSMNRNQLLIGHIDKRQRGIEIGPWCHPLLPKRVGYAVTILDVYSSETLRQRALADPDLPPDCAAAIEEVDLVGSACDIGELAANAGLAGRCDYVVASHAFEHLPDPIRFLQGCERCLRPGGQLSLAIPDKRGCFDYFRPVSSLAEMLAAYFEKRRQPALTQVFERWSLHARWRRRDGTEQISFPLDVPQEDIEPYDSLLTAYAEWQQAIDNNALPYQDTHCWVLTPANFTLILHDLQTLRLTRLTLSSCTPCGGEFIVHLENPGESAPALSASDRVARRKELMHAALRESGAPAAAHAAILPGSGMRWGPLGLARQLGKKLRVIRTR